MFQISPFNCIFILETGGIMISPLPLQENIPPKPACPMFPFFGVDPVLLDEEVILIKKVYFTSGGEIHTPPHLVAPLISFALLVFIITFFFQGKELNGNDVSGLLCLKSSLPGMARTIYGDHERFLDVYYKPQPGIHFFVYRLLLNARLCTFNLIVIQSG